MRLDVANNETYYYVLVCIVSFFCGFGWPVLLVPMVIVLAFVSIYLFDINKVYFDRRFILSYYVLFIVMLFLIASGVLSDNHRYIRVGINYVMQGAIIGFAYQFFSSIKRQNILLSYVVGLFLSAVYYWGYSYYNAPESFGYGFIVNPYTNEMMNSPGISNMLVLGNVVIAFYLYWERKAMRMFVLFLAFIFVNIMGVYLGGRIIFIVDLIVVFIMMRKKGLNMIIVLVLIAFYYKISTLLVHDKYFNFLYNRFLREGVDSPRWLLYQQGIYELFDNPLGGGMPKYSVTGYDGVYFHNIFLDLGRISGIIPVILYLLFIVYVIYVSLKRYKDKAFWFFETILFASLMLSFQDVVFEGNPSYIMLIYYSSISLFFHSYFEKK